MYVNSVYDRSVLTFMTDLIKNNFSDEKILEAIKIWGPLPDVLFYCDISPEIALERSEKRSYNVKDDFDELKSLQEYYELYKKSVEFIEKYKLIHVVKLDSRKTVQELVEDVRKESDMYVK